MKPERKLTRFAKPSALLLTLLMTISCASSPKATPTTPGALSEIKPIIYNYGTAAEPCEDEGGTPLPDPKNQCDTPETVARILVLNAQISALTN